MARSYSPWGHGGSVYSVVLSPDGRRILTGSLDKTAKLWDAGKGQEIFLLKGQPQQVTSVGFNLDGRRILAQDWEGKILAWDAVTGNLLPHPPAQMPAARQATSRDGRLLVRIQNGGRWSSVSPTALGTTYRRRGDGAAGTLRPGLSLQAPCRGGDMPTTISPAPSTWGICCAVSPGPPTFWSSKRMCSPARDSPSRPLSALPAPCCSTPRVPLADSGFASRGDARSCRAATGPARSPSCESWLSSPGPAACCEATCCWPNWPPGTSRPPAAPRAPSSPRCPARGTPLSRPSRNPGCQQLRCPRRTPGSGSNTHARPCVRSATP